MEDLTPNIFVEAIDLTHDALGVCKLDDGYTIFVEDLLKGEKAEVIITERRKSYGFAKIVNRLTRSPYRVAPKCKHFYECGGCALMHMDYDVQLSFKKYRIEAAMKHQKFNDVEVKDIMGMINPYFYRNKVEIKFKQSEKGIEAGFFQAKSHRLVNLEECYIMGKRSFELLILLKNVCNELKITAFDDESGLGLLKSAVIRESYKTKEIVLLLNLAKNEFTQKELFVKKLTAKILDLVGIAFSVSKDESTLSTDKIEVIFGKDYITDQINNITYEIGYRSFFQVNTSQTEKLYQKALSYAGLDGKDKVIDAYCGIGSIGLNAAKNSYKVYGIELVKQAIADARKNAKINNITNALFEVGEAETVILKWKKYNFDVIFIDPPRKGCEKAFLNAIIVMKIKKIVYVSCDQATLSRDLRILVDGGYEIQEITPIDMFPQTIHVESVTLLTLK